MSAMVWPRPSNQSWIDVSVGLGDSRERHHFSLDRATACSGVCEDLREGLGFLLVGQCIVGIAQDNMQTAAHDG